MWRARRRAVEIGRNAELVPDPRRGAMGEGHRVVERRRAQRNERQNVERADARVRAAVPAQIDAVARNARQGDRRRDRLRCVADGSEDAAMMDRVARPVDDARALRFDRSGARVDQRRIASLAQVRNDLELEAAQRAYRR